MKERVSFSQRKNFCTNQVTKKLFEIIEHKKTNLALSLDVTSAHELITMADKLGPHICLLKTHIDIIDDFSVSLIEKLKELSSRHNFLLFEDRKFADIGNTVYEQYKGGAYKISSWADMVNAHILPGEGIINGLKKEGLAKNRGLLLIAQMSSKGSFLTDAYTQAAVEMALCHKDFVMGFICQEKISDDPSFVYITPGVQLQEGIDELGQQYQTPKTVIKKGSDVILVGRGIIKAKEPLKEALVYKEACWQAYMEDLADHSHSMVAGGFCVMS